MVNRFVSVKTCVMHKLICSQFFFHMHFSIIVWIDRWMFKGRKGGPWAWAIDYWQFGGKQRLCLANCSPRNGKRYECASNDCVNFVLPQVKSVPNFMLFCHKNELSRDLSFSTSVLYRSHSSAVNLISSTNPGTEFVSAALRQIQIWQTGRDSTAPKKAEPAYL